MAAPEPVKLAMSDADAIRLNQSPSRLTICPNQRWRKLAFSRTSLP